MLYKVTDLTFDIGEDYRAEEDDKEAWAVICQTVNNYTDGSWESTCWILSAMYGESSDNRLNHSFSVAVSRQNGDTLVETASNELAAGIKEATGTVSAEQTDERYLQNLAQRLPTRIGNYRLLSTAVTEYLIQPYYSTA